MRVDGLGDKFDLRFVKRHPWWEWKFAKRMSTRDGKSSCFLLSHWAVTVLWQLFGDSEFSIQS